MAARPKAEQRTSPDLRALLTGTDLAIGFLDLDLCYVQANPALAALFDVPTLIGLTPGEVGDAGDHIESRLRGLVRTGRPVTAGSGDSRISYRRVLDDRDQALGISVTSVAKVSSDRLAQLKLEAETDGLTGLVNHRVFQERLRSEFDRAARYGRALSLVMIDVDGFKLLNDTFGHQAGDDVLERVAAHLAATGRTSDTVARVGGDEFAILLPETDAGAARIVAERSHDRIRKDASIPESAVTISVGICDLQHATTAEELLRFADGSLFWAKAHGRDSVCVYDPKLVEDLSLEERADRLVKNKALAGIRSLARATEAKDTSTLLHSERVASLVARLAEALEVRPDQVTALREVALIHDVGKIGIPLEVLLKPSALTDSEFEIVKTHALLGAQIATDVLSADQLSWLRGHHENYDGSGYPDGLAGNDIPQGALLLRLADSWDVMTSERSYSVAMSATEAIAECQKCAGTQFSPEAVAVLTRPGFERILRMIANEQLTRDRNEARLAGDPAATFMLNCECGRDDCKATVELPAGDYRTVRLSQRRYIVQVGHEIPEIEELIVETPAYTIVEEI